MNGVILLIATCELWVDLYLIWYIENYFEGKISKNKLSTNFY